MPVADITSARNTVMGMVTTAWKALSTPPPLFYDDQDDGPTTPPLYGVATFQHTTSDYASLGPRPLYDSNARLVVDIFTPYGEGMSAADRYVKMVQATFRGKKSIGDSVWFRAVRVTEMPRQGARKKTRVVVDVQYSEIT